MAPGPWWGDHPLNLLRKGECVIEGGTREPSFFLAVRKERSRHSLLLGDGGSAGSTSVFDAFPPPFYGGIPAAFFIACGRPNQERSSPPLLTVLLLLTSEKQEEGDWASNEGTQETSEVWAPQGSFFVVRQI